MLAPLTKDAKKPRSSTKAEQVLGMGNIGSRFSSVVLWTILKLREVLERQICSSDPPSYDELRGIFYSEYQRWRVGPRKHLYESDRAAFRDEFGKHMDARRENHPDEYVRLLLGWSSHGHKQLPCLIFDNTDQFTATIQDAVYQLAHSYESAAPTFNLVPITDRTVWRLSKAGALQSYSATSFYLPVPDAKEIISRRVEFLKGKIKEEPTAAKSYFSRRGFQVEINDLVVLADAVERVFVENDYVSGFIGRLGNFDIRRMLKIAERVFLSPELRIDEIIKSRFGGPDIADDRVRTQRALIRGEYDRFNESENEYISNLFQTDAKRPGSPLLNYYLLWLLRQRAQSVRPGDDDVENRHWAVLVLCQYLEGCGVAEDIVISALNRLYSRRMIEGLDPNLERIGVSDKVAIKECGLAHLELVQGASVYVEQMALVTGLNEQAAYEEIKAAFRRSDFIAVRLSFLRYILKIDRGRIGIPPLSQYRQLQEARRSIEGMSDVAARLGRSTTRRSQRPTPHGDAKAG